MRVTVSQETRDGFEVKITPILPHVGPSEDQQVLLMIEISDLSKPESERLINDGFFEMRGNVVPGRSLDLTIEREH